MGNAGAEPNRWIFRSCRNRSIRRVGGAGRIYGTGLARHYCMKFGTAAGVIVVAALLVWSSRASAAKEAAEYAPAATPHVLVPPGTAIQAVITNGISASAGAGDSITAFVSRPVTAADQLVIPAGARLNGYLQAVNFQEHKVQATIDFTRLRIGGQSFVIETEPVRTVAPAQSDTRILGNALRTVIGAGLGAGLGAASGIRGVVDRMFIEGAMDSLPVQPIVAIRVILAGDLKT